MFGFWINFKLGGLEFGYKAASQGHPESWKTAVPQLKQTTLDLGSVLQQRFLGNHVDLMCCRGCQNLAPRKGDCQGLIEAHSNFGRWKFYHPVSASKPQERSLKTGQIAALSPLQHDKTLDLVRTYSSKFHQSQSFSNLQPKLNHN